MDIYLAGLALKPYHFTFVKYFGETNKFLRIFECFFYVETAF